MKNKPKDKPKDKPEDTSPADEPRPAYVVSRIRYFDGEFLATRDFVDEQNYHVDRQTRHQACLHAPGILEGLEVTQAGELAVNVGFGSALDANGNQILVSSADGDSSGNPILLDVPPEDGDYFVDIKFDEDSDPQSAQSGSGGNTRFTQKPGAMLAIGTSLRDGAVPLARVRVTGGAIYGVDTHYFSTSGATQKYAGLRLPGPTDSDAETASPAAVAATVRFENINTNPDGYCPGDSYPDPNYKVTFDQPLFLKRASSGQATNLEIEQGALVFLDSPGDIWAHGYNQRILLHNDGVELMAHANVTLTTNNADGNSEPIQTLVACPSGAVGIGTDTREPKARLEVMGPIPDPHGIHASDPVALNLQVSRSDGSASLTVADSGETTVAGPLTAQRTLDVIGTLTASNGLTVDNVALTANAGLTVTGTASVSETLTANGGLAVNGDLKVWDSSGDKLMLDLSSLTVTAKVALVANGGLTVGGGLIAQRTASVTGMLSADGGLTVNGTASVSDTLTANGGLTLNGASSLFGSRQKSMSFKHTFTATTDGFVSASVGYTSPPVNNGAGAINVKVFEAGSTEPIYTHSAYVFFDLECSENAPCTDRGSVTVPVRSGQQFEVTTEGTGDSPTDFTAYWLPLGTGSPSGDNS